MPIDEVKKTLKQEEEDVIFRKGVVSAGSNASSPQINEGTSEALPEPLI